MDEFYYCRSGNDLYNYEAKWYEVSHIIESYHNGDEHVIIDRPRMEMKFSFNTKSGELTLPIIGENGSVYLYFEDIYNDIINEIHNKYNTPIIIRLLGNPYSLCDKMPNVFINNDCIKLVKVVINSYSINDINNIMKLANISHGGITLEMKYISEFENIIDSISTLWKYIAGTYVLIISE